MASDSNNGDDNTYRKPLGKGCTLLQDPNLKVREG
jgi:hypothetical protein